MWRTFLLGISLGAAALPAGAQVTATLTLTPGGNGVSAYSTAQTGIFQGVPGPGGPSGITSWQGTITVRLDDAFAPTSLTIVAASLVAANSGNYYPNPNLTPPTAPGNYGFSYPGSQNFLSTAVRGLTTGLQSASLPLVSGSGSYDFAPAGVALSLTGGYVDHRIPSHVTGTGYFPRISLANDAASGGTLTLDGSTLAVAIPLDATFTMPIYEPFTNGQVRDIVSFRFLGTLNATGVIPEPSAGALVVAGLLLAAGLRARRKAPMA